MIVLLALLALGAPAPAKSKLSAAQRDLVEAQRDYAKLRQDSERRKYRHNWLKVVESFEGVAEDYPKSPQAAEATLAAGSLAAELSRISRKKEDLLSAQRAFERLISRWPTHPLAGEGALALARLHAERRDDPKKARAVLEAALARAPKNARDLRGYLALLKSPAPHPDVAKGSANASAQTKAASKDRAGAQENSGVHSSLEKPSEKVVRPEGVRPEGVRPEGARPEGARPEVARPEVARPKGASSEGARSEVVPPEVARPEVARPAGARPAGARPEGARPEVARPEVARSEGASSEGARSEVVPPEVARPAGARPAGARPAGARPEVARQEGARPEVMRPAGARPEVMRPAGARSEIVRPEVMRQEGARSGVVRPEVARPEGARSEVVRPEVMRPEGARPEVARQEGARPEVARQEGARPEGARPEKGHAIAKAIAKIAAAPAHENSGASRSAAEKRPSERSPSEKRAAQSPKHVVPEKHSVAEKPNRKNAPMTEVAATEADLPEETPVALNGEAAPSEEAPRPDEVARKPSPPASRKIVIDAGHGGFDPGARGRHGLREKDVTLEVAKKLAARLRAAGYTVQLTREDDRYLRLEERTRIANAAGGDLFISLHCNAAPSPKLRGVETYTLNTSADRYAIRLAAQENASSESGISDLQYILADLDKKANTDDSRRLAADVQRSLTKKLSATSGETNDLGTKEALFFVLLGVKMPAILLEMGFLSNLEEEKQLRDSAHQELIARGVSEGIVAFLNEPLRVAGIK